MKEIAYQVESGKSFEELTELLEKTSPARGFRVLAVHDTQATLAEKGFQIEPLKIFEVCNASFAYKALGKNIDAALFMPCKIVVRSGKGKTVMTLAKPSMIAEMLPGSGLEEMANEVEYQLIAIMNEVK
ncbi:MAG: DUF302 domain-containing protein [candidate division Zixibacteria bacterium]|nr:DUF302 domain-containing protein [candidate division Zixibacteria bacterium]